MGKNALKAMLEALDLLLIDVRAHPAGADLTEAPGEAPHGEEVLDAFSPIGVLKVD